MIGLFLLLIVVAVLAAVLGAVLMVVARVLVARKPDFAEAWGTMFIVLILTMPIGYLIELVFGTGRTDPAIEAAIQAGVSFLILTITIAYRLEATLIRAVLTSIAMTAAIVGISFAFDAIMA